MADTTDGVRAVLLAGGEGRRMGWLGDGLPKPLVPFGGACRLIDFSLANAHGTGFGEVLLLSQHEERRIMDTLHLGWNTTSGFRVHFGPHDAAYRSSRDGEPPRAPLAPTGPRERGTADALIRKAEYVFGEETSEVLVLHADHVYHHDYGHLIAEHRASRAALTVAYQRVERRWVHLFGMVGFDGRGNLTDFVEKPPEPTSDLVFAAFCVFDATVLHRYLELLDGTCWQHDLSRDVIPAMLARGERIRGYEVRAHWEDIGTVERYHRAHLALTGPRAPLPVAGMPWTLSPGTHRSFVERAEGITRSVVPDGLVNGGRLDRCVVFPGARIGTGARVHRSVVMPGARVPDHARIDSSVVLGTGETHVIEHERTERII
ncbi:glucose-1-phosphate adenylyltransferase 1 [Nocardiopsis kunsanensis]|uniref:Glucose-1-phosphate adenylyltransferase 1 n=1 Tax=Nocardiopsis kunsanensis TaxID=141693 RepID=A0A918XBF9_9ACTN|nr:sugar phosphate nucleotidyltransferase [Nocardiopsis kunsanensis]GHD24902.1 glucose-1-phosphate adenylyltransferase 1 [Nocardiopsis kunsanensis]